MNEWQAGRKEGQNAQGEEKKERKRMEGRRQNGVREENSRRRKYKSYPTLVSCFRVNYDLRLK